MVDKLDAALGSLNQAYPCRDNQISQLVHLLSPWAPCPPVLVLHGLAATGKTSVVRAVLEETGTPHVIVRSKECITGRHLLEQTTSACLEAVQALGQTVDPRTYPRCETINALGAHLQRMLEGMDKFVLVFDGIDEQREAPPFLMPGLGRLGELIPGLTTVLIITAPSPRMMHMAGVPHVAFPAYTSEQLVQILSKTPLAIDPNTGADPTDTIWPRYLSALQSSLGGAIPNLPAFRSLARKLWTPFVAPVLSGTVSSRDFAKLMLQNRALFQSDEPLVARLVRTDPSDATASLDKLAADLPYYAKYLLCAAYLASFNPARQDPVFFMRATDKKRRRHRGPATGRAPKNRKMARKLLAPATFPLERMLAIFHSIVPHRVADSADLYTSIATLTSLRLLVRSGIGQGDILDGGARLRVNVGWAVVNSVGRSVHLDLAEFLLEA